MILTFHIESHFDRPPAGLLFGQQAELHRGAGRHLWSGKVPVLPANTAEHLRRGRTHNGVSVDV